MRIEILISNLLFGMTILTGALALAHLFGDFLVSGRNINPRIRKALRVLIAMFSVAVCLAIFLNFSNAGMQRNFFSILHANRPLFLPSPRLVVSDPAAAIKGFSASANFIDEERLQVLSEQIPDEVLNLTQGNALRDYFADMPKLSALYDLNDKLAEDCISWHGVLSAYGLIRSGPIDQESSLIFGCASAPAEHKQWQQIEQNQKKSLLIVGAAGQSPHKMFSSLFPEATFSASAFQDDYAVALTGADLLSFPFPPGPRFFLGKEWMGRPGTVMSIGGSVSIVDSRWQSIAGPSAVLSKSVSDGRRVLWTSLPAKLYGKLEFSYEPYWKMIHLHMLSWLNAVPHSASSPLPVAFGQTVIRARTQVDRKVLPNLSPGESLIVDSQNLLVADNIKSVPELIVKYEVSAKLQNTESPKVYFKKLQDSVAKDRKEFTRILFTNATDGSLQYALEQDFTGILQSVITDRPVPFIPATRRLKDGPENAVPTATGLLMTAPSFESDASIGLRSRGSTLSGVPSMQFVAAKSSENGRSVDDSDLKADQQTLSLSEYFNYWRQRAKVSIEAAFVPKGLRHTKSGSFIVTNRNNEPLKSLSVIYSEANSIKIIESEMVKVNPQQLAADIGVFVISEIKPQAVVKVAWEAKQ